MPPAIGRLAANPLPPGIAGALSLTGYQLLSELQGVGAGRLGPQVFLLVAPDPDRSGAGVAGRDPAMTQISLHQPRLRDEREASAFVALAGQLGLLRLSGYRLVLERCGLRSRIGLLDPATGAIALQVPEKHPGRLFGGSGSVAALLAAARTLPPAGPPPAPTDPDLVRGALVALAVRDDSLSGVEAAELADRAVALTTGEQGLDLAAALQAARTAPGSGS